MTLKKIAICAAALVAATIASPLAQAAGKGAPSSPGHPPAKSGDPGKSGKAPGDLKHDSGAANAKELAPGDQKSDLKSKKK